MNHKNNTDAPCGDKVIIANCSGFFGDRLSAAKQMVQGGPIDVLTGDYLAELTMAILFGKKMKNPAAGYVETFLVQMKEVMEECLSKGIKIVANAGGLNPAGLAAELEKIAAELGLSPKIAYIEGDDLMARLKTLQEKGESFAHADTGNILKNEKARPVSANAYTGCWGIADALGRGADIVVGGRLADAALVAGPAAFKFAWGKDDWDKLAGACAAGHIIECGTQATGGNYSFFEEVPDFTDVGFPIAEVYEDGSSVITKHPGTGGLVSVGTVTAQLLYEIRGPQYLTPDVTAVFDSLDIRQAGADRVLVTGAKGWPPPDTAKVCINLMAGHRNTMTVILTGLDIERKASIVEHTLFKSLGGKDRFQSADVQLIRADKSDPAVNEEAFAYLRISVMDPDPNIVGKIFSSGVVNLALANVPGFTLTAPPGKPALAIRHWPAMIASAHIRQKVVMGQEESVIEPIPGAKPSSSAPMSAETVLPKHLSDISANTSAVKTRPMRLGRLFATRSGDKGGNANLGVWGKSSAEFAFLRDFLSIEKLRELLPDTSGFEIERYELAKLNAVNFYIIGLLGDGVANTRRMDGQAKTLGEYLRMRIIDIPEALIKTGESQSGD